MDGELIWGTLLSNITQSGSGRKSYRQECVEAKGFRELTCENR